jgi:uncharacterized cupredoxin-like copper-binding protein
VLLALTTGHKIGLATAAVIFVVFALMSAVIIPRFRPSFPGRVLPLFILVTIALFVMMMTSVAVFGRESEETGAKEEKTATTATQTTPSKATKVTVDETEFKITMPSTRLKAGAYEFDVKNTGKLGHDLVVKGAGVNTKTPVFGPGKTETLAVTLKPGSYNLYCSVPGHKQAGMDLNITVS